MFVIWGSKDKERRVKDGFFYCPNCHENAAYTHMQRGRYFSLYFIPLFQTANLGEYVQCETCANVFAPDVILLEPEQIEQLLEQWICSECKESNPLEAEACAKCSAERPDEHIFAPKMVSLEDDDGELLVPKEPMTSCPSCNAEVSVKVQKCPCCGWPETEQGQA